MQLPIVLAVLAVPVVVRGAYATAPHREVFVFTPGLGIPSSSWTPSFAAPRRHVPRKRMSAPIPLTSAPAKACVRDHVQARAVRNSRPVIVVVRQEWTRKTATQDLSPASQRPRRCSWPSLFALASTASARLLLFR